MFTEEQKKRMRIYCFETGLHNYDLDKNKRENCNCWKWYIKYKYDEIELKK